MSSFTLHKKSNPCPICDSNSGKCKTSDRGLTLCMSLVDGNASPAGYRFVNLTKNGLWGIWAVDDGSQTQDDRDRWLADLDRRRELRARQDEQRRSRSIPIGLRHKLYSEILNVLELHPDDRADLHRRGFSDEAIARHGFKSIERGNRLPREYPQNLPGIAHDGRSLAVAGDGYLCPIKDADGQIHGLQLRLRGAIANKYRWLSTDSNHRLENGEVPLAHYQGGDRPWIAFCEGTGPKPALASDRLGCPVMGAAGGQFQNSVEQVKAAIASGLQPVLLPDGGAIQNPHVMRQYRALAEMVPGLKVLWWEQFDKSDGDIDEISDDAIAAARLISFAEFSNFAPPEIPKVVALQGLRRSPDLHIGTDEFKSHVDQFPQCGILALHGAKGTGKGEAQAELLEGERWLSVTHLRSLARDQAQGWNGDFWNDCDRGAGQLVGKDGSAVSGISLCVPSLLKALKSSSDVLVIDEIPAVLSMLFSSKLAAKNGKRSLLIEELIRRIREARLVIVASADLTDEQLRWIEAIRGERAFLVATDRKPLDYPAIFLEGSKNQAIADCLEAHRQLPSGKLLMIHCDAKKTADAIAAQIDEHGGKAFLITADTSGDPSVAEFLSSKGADLPRLVSLGYTAIVTSPSVKEGFSIQNHTDLITSVWCFFEGGSIDVAGMAQTCDRLRSSTITRYIWCAKHGRAHSKLSKAESITAFMREFQSSMSQAARLARASLHTEAIASVDAIDWYSGNMRMLASLEVERNRGMRGLRGNLMEALSREGKRVSEQPCQASKSEGKALALSIKASATKLERERAIAVENAATITEAEAEALSRKDALTPDEQLSLEKYYLSQFYRIEAVDHDLVLWDKNGARRDQIRNLEAILNPQLAEQVAAKSINTNPTTPQDWNRQQLQQQLIEESGGGDLIRGIYRGEITEISNEAIAPIAAFLKSNSERVRLAGFSNIQGVSDRQAAFLILDWCGITRVSERYRSEGKIQRRYLIDQENLEKVKTIVERRSQVDPPPLSLVSNEGGGSTPMDWYSPEGQAILRQDLRRGIPIFWAPQDAIDRAIASEAMEGIAV